MHGRALEAIGAGRMKECEMLLRRYKIPVVVLLVGLLLLNPAVCPAADLERQVAKPTPGNTFIDALLYRPVGLILIPAGAVLFVFTLPFSAIGRNVGQSFDNLVATPARYTFVRPLGDI